MEKIEIFTGPRCGYCEQAKALLQRRGLNYRELDVSEAGVADELRRRLPRARALPQIFIDDHHVGGLDDLRIRLRDTED